MLNGCGREESVSTEPEAGIGLGGPTLAASSVSTPATDGRDLPQTISGDIAKQLPEFGGAYIDADGTLTVYLNEEGHPSVAEQIVTTELQKRGRDALPVKVRVGRYSFRQLWEWRLALLPVLGMPGVVLSGIDERNNQLRIGITSEEARPALERALHQLQIPASAVTIEIVPPPVPLVTLRDRVRPAVGGLQIQGNFAQNGQTYNLTCTYGLNVRNQNDLANRYMVVNSHCTQVSPQVGGLIGAKIYQHVTSSLNLIGTETSDPAYTSGAGCPSGTFCRYSDAALVRVASTATTTLGEIARTTSRTFLPTIYGSLTIDPATPRFTISGPIDALVGDTVEKVGRTTGWTAGVVTALCTDVNLGGYVRQCSGVVSAGAGRGDSGSPVFWQNRLGRYYVDGILYGGVLNGTDGNSGNTYYFSHWRYVSSELAGFPGLTPN